MRTADQIGEAGIHNWKYLALELSEASDFLALARAIPKLISLERIKLVCHVRRVIWENTSATESHQGFFQALGSLPQLKTIMIDAFGIDEDDEFRFPLPIQHLTAMFRQPHCNISFVGLSRISIEGDAGTIFEFAQSVQRLTQLEKLTVTFCGTDDDGSATRGGLFYNALIEALAKATKIRRAMLWSDSDFHPTSLRAEPLRKLLCSSNTLMSLSLKDFHLDDECLSAMAQSLENGSLLQCLKFDLYLDISNGGLALARSLAVNRTLRILDIRMSVKVNQQLLLTEVANALVKNTTMKDLKLIGNIDKGNEYAKMLETNCDLEAVRVTADKETQAMIDFYLKLNRANRRLALQEYGTLMNEDWLDLITKAADELDLIYYFIHMNPSLLQGAHFTSSVKDKRDREEICCSIHRPAKRMEI